MTFEELDQLLAAQAIQLEFERGYRDGFEQACRTRETDWQPVAERLQRIFDQPTHAELELRRWGPGGRKHFGNPRPGDFPGRNRG